MWTTRQGIVCWKTSYKDISPQVAPGSPGICDVWIPDPSVSSKKRADPGEQQDTSNCMRERKKVCDLFQEKGKSFIFRSTTFFLLLL